MVDTASIILNNLYSLLSNTITIPSEFHGKVNAVKSMQKDDVSGMVDSLTDFQVDTATVDYKIETSNSNLTKLLNDYLENIINRDYEGQIPRGIKYVSKEYFWERWKASSFCVLKINPKWEYIDGLWLPTKMFFIDGGSIYSEEKNKESSIQSFLPYDYYLGRERPKNGKLNKDVIITKPFNRPFDEYPNPYLMKRGVYHNWAILEMLKNRQSELVTRVISYLLSLKLGSPEMEIANKGYKDGDFKKVVKDLKDMVHKLDNTTNVKSKIPVRATNWDEVLEHVIPDLTKMFDPKLYTSLEKHIMAGLGFIDVLDVVSSNRQESIINPKAFMSQTKTGVEDFKIQILKELMHRIVDKNKAKHKKILSDNLWWKVTSSPVTGFITDQFKQHLRMLWERGQLSNQTYSEMVGEISYNTELIRREKEATNGEEITMYPHQTQNIEKDETFEERKRQEIFYDKKPIKKLPKDTDKRGKSIPTDKLDDRQKYNMATKKDLYTAPYKDVKNLPKSIRENMDINLQRIFIRVFNDAYAKYGNDTRAFRIAWGVIKKIAKKDANGKWVKKTKTKLTKSMIKEIEKNIN